MNQPAVPIPPAWIVRIELQRIQTFLFAVPRLRAMLGANALLGDAIRSALPQLAQQHCAKSYDWPESVDLKQPTQDPLAEVSAGADDWAARDNPEEALKQGILSRDGGHLRVVFLSETQAAAFATAACDYLADAFPDLLFSIDMVGVGTEPQPRGALESGRLAHLPELPHFQVCTLSGFGVASKAAETKRPGEQDVYVSRATRIKEVAGKRFQQGKGRSLDYISLLRDQMPGSSGNCLRPDDLKQLADDGGYLALVHADGNQVGKRVKAYEHSRKHEKLDWLAQECDIEAFFHSMRSAVRSALMAALNKVFPPKVLDGLTYLPYQLLMLGGDDLLLLCHPRYALLFVHAYAQALAKLDLIDDHPLSIGAGVVIAKHSLPFHRLHQLAESLASSAKRVYLQYAPDQQDQPLAQRSVVDWTVLTSSWGEDPMESRRRHDLVRYGTAEASVALALTAKPYLVLDQEPGADVAPYPCLETLLCTAEALGAIDELPRSQLKSMLRDLEQGLEWSTLAYRELLPRLPEQARTQVQALIGDDSPWGDNLAADAKTKAHVTQLKDLIECLELRYLGRRKQETRRV